MKTLKKIYLSGLGAVGAAYASKLQDTDPDCLKVIADKERIERYTKNGIIINGKPYSFNYIEPDTDAEPADLVIIAVKQHHLEQSIRDIKKFIGKDTIILSLLNGISSEEIIGKVYGTENILYSFCVGIDAVREGTSTEFSSSGRIVFGEKSNNKHSPNVLAVKELFERANIVHAIPDSIMRELWWKFMVNVGINQASAVLKAPYGIFQKVKEASELMEMAAKEVIMLSRKAGINLEDSDIEGFVKVLHTLSPDGKTSMLQDVEAKRKTEVEIFAGAVIELGEKYGVETPVNQVLFRMIRTMEQMYLNKYS